MKESKGMKKSLLIVLAVILVFTGIFTGISIWQYNRDLAAFPADGYVLAGEADAGVVSCDYFSAGTKYSRNYAENMVFRTSLGTDAKVDNTSFIHYTDGSLSAFTTGIVLDVEKLHSGTRDSYFLEGGMVLTKEGSGYSIDNNGNTLEFQDILWMIDDMKFLVGSENMVLTLPSGTTQDLSGYVEVTYVDENVVQICNEEQIWQTVPTGTKITLSNGEVIDLGTGDITGTDGTVYGSLNDILADLTTGGGVAIASNSAMDWKPPTFEFEAIDGQDGEAGEDGEAGIDGVAGEAGTDGENGVDGTSGSNGSNGSNGVDGASGSNGANGSDGVSGSGGAGGSAGSNGAGGSAGASAAAGAAGSTETNGALAKVLISDLKYDCASLDITFYADGDADTLVYGTAYVKVVETKTNQEVARIDYNSWEMDLPSTSSGSPVTVHATGLHADTEYTVQIYSGYKVGNAEQGTKAFASRTFYTSGDGVEMSFGTISQDQVTIHLDRQSYSTIRSGKLCLAFEDVDSSGNSQITRIWSEEFALTGSTDVTISLLAEDGETYIENLKSNIPFTVTLFTSEGELAAGRADGRWEVDDDGASEPAGVEAGSVEKSAQELSGRTLKVTPEYGTLLIYESAKGCYSISVNGIVDPDGAIQSYNYKIYTYEDDGSKTLVKQLYSANDAAVELYVDEDSIQYNKEYYVECTINYNDNEKPYSILVTEGNNPFTTGSGNAVVSYVAGDVANSSRYGQTTTTGPSFLYGNLKIDTNEAGFALDLGQTGNVTNIRVDVTSGSDYSQSLTYDSWDSVSRSEVESDAAKLDKATYVTDDKILYLPVDLWGLKEGSPYTFTVYAYVKYSDATSAYKYVGSGLGVTTEYGNTTYAMDKNGTKVSRSLEFKLESLTGRKIDESDMSADAETYDDKFAVGISLTDNWSDGRYPLEVTSARALEVKVSPLNLDGSESGSTIVNYVDLYQEKSGVVDSATSEAKDPYVWLSQDKTVNPMVEYLQNDQEPYLYVFDTDDLGSVSSYTKLKVEVSAVYDYTYNASYGFKEEAACNVSGYANEIDFTSDTLNMDISGDNKPSLSDYSYLTNRDEAVSASPIKNTGNSGSDYTPVTDVLGSGSQDPALASDTIRGYRLEADFQSGTMATVTYYAFTFDDWVAFGEAKNGDQSAELQEYDDIMKAAEANVAPWSDKVTAVTITIDPDKYDGITAPPLYLIYTDDATKESEGTEAVYNEERGCYLYYTNALKRGQTWLFSFSETDRCVTDEDLTPKYTFPYDDILYGHNNQGILRCKPQMMDRQAPQVQLTLEYTDTEGNQSWKFTAYDPDQALGMVDADGKLNSWKELTEILPGHPEYSTKWGLGYIMAVTETNMSVYAGNGCIPYETTEKANEDSFATIDMSSSNIHAMTLEELNAAYKYNQGTGSYVQQISAENSSDTKAGIAWKGTFSLKNGSCMGTGSSTLHYIYLSRRLNDSAYVTNSTETDNVYEKGAGYDLKSMPSLRYMAAASSVYEKVYGSSAFNDRGKFYLNAVQIGNNIRFSLGSGSTEESRITGLEVTVWQDKGGGEYTRLGTKNISYTPSSQTTDGVVASFSVTGSFSNAQAKAKTLMQVRTIYDTGMYGSCQYSFQETEGVDRWNLTTGETSWLVRQQGAATWYTNVATASDSNRKYKLAGASTSLGNSYIWYSNDKNADALGTGDNNMTWKLGRRNLVSNEVWPGPFTIDLTNAISTGTGYVKGEAFKGLAVGGWQDQETGKNVVLGVLGITTTPLAVNKDVEGVGLNTKEITLDGNLYPVSTLLSFVTPESQIEFNTTSSIPGTGSSGIKLGMGEAVLKKMKSDEAEYEYYPYLFLELYEGTQTTTSSGAMYQEDGKYYKVNSTHKGNLLTDQKYFGEDATVGLAAATGTLINGAADNSVLSGIPAVQLDFSDGLSKGITTDLVFRNLTSGKYTDAEENYSLRVYVLPVRDSNGNKIDYGNLTEDSLKSLKCYVKDTSAQKNRSYTYYDPSSTDYNNWYKILTRSTEAFTNQGSAVYKAESYTSKSETVAYNLLYNMLYQDDTVQSMTVTYSTTSGNTTTRTMPEAYIEYQLVDDKGEIVLTHDDIMKASGYTASIAKATSYDATTGEKITETPVVVYTNSSSLYIPTNNTQRLLITQMNRLMQEGKIIAGENYKLQARICYVNPALNGNGCDETTEQWNPVATEAGVKTLVPSGSATKKISIDLKVPTGTDPAQTISANYTKNNTNGLDMKVNLRVTDNIYYNVSTWESGKTVPTDAKVYVKVYDRTTGSDEVTGNFSYNGSALKKQDGTYQLIPTNSSVTLTWSGNTNYEHRYEVQIWGTTNSVKHTEDADDKGNVLLASSENDSTLKSFLTMPGSSGIDFKNTTLTYNKNNSQLTLKVLAGSGYNDLTGAVMVTINGNDKTATYSADGLSWKSDSCSITLSSTEAKKISTAGTYSATFSFTSKDGHTKYIYTQYFTVVK